MPNTKPRGSEANPIKLVTTTLQPLKRAIDPLRTGQQREEEKREG